MTISETVLLMLNQATRIYAADEWRFSNLMAVIVCRRYFARNMIYNN